MDGGGTPGKEWWCVCVCQINRIWLIWARWWRPLFDSGAALWVYNPVIPLRENLLQGVWLTASSCPTSGLSGTSLSQGCFQLMSEHFGSTKLGHACLTQGSSKGQYLHPNLLRAVLLSSAFPIQFSFFPIPLGTGVKSAPQSKAPPPTFSLPLFPQEHFPPQISQV